MLYFSTTPLSSVYCVGSNDDPGTHHYWTETTGHFQDRNHIEFGADMAGVANPIVVSFDTWPVRLDNTLQGHIGDEDTFFYLRCQIPRCLHALVCIVAGLPPVMPILRLRLLRGNKCSTYCTRCL